MPSAVHAARVYSIDESSVSGINHKKEDWKLHITNPFFGYFLKWKAQ